jgi:hypothetical protein
VRGCVIRRDGVRLCDFRFEFHDLHISVHITQDTRIVLDRRIITLRLILCILLS